MTMNFYELVDVLKDMDINVDGKVEKDGTFSAKVTFGQKGPRVKKEIDLIDINRDQDLSGRMLKKAFGPDFDTSVGRPKSVR